MMGLLIDEDTAVQIIEPLRHVLLGHEVAHISGLSWKGKKDLRVLPDARNAGFHALITRDRLSSAIHANATRSRSLGSTTSATPSVRRERGASPWP
jgi:hypothetical protein